MNLEVLLSEYERLLREGLITEEQYQQRIAGLRTRLIEHEQEERRLASILRVAPGTAGRVLRSQVFWVVLVLAMMPLVMIAFGIPTDSGLILYFASLWFLLYLNLFRLDLRGTVLWDYLLVVSLTMPGIVLLLPALRLPLSWCYRQTQSPEATDRLVGYLLGVGPAEELTKMVPIVAALLLARHVGRRPSLQAAIMLGITSGLAFAGFENMLYSDWFGTRLWGLPYTRQDVVLSRLLMTPFLHSLWSGMSGFAIGIACTGRPLSLGRMLRLGVPALVLAAALHGLYDTMASAPLLAVAMAAVSYLILVVAIAAAKQWEGDTAEFLHDRFFSRGEP